MTDKQKEAQLEYIMELVRKEVQRAISLWPSQQSTMEGLAILEEEVDELKVEVRKEWPHTTDAMRMEAIQVAAMAVRFILDN